ncbi:GntR family transcriptional regulator [Microbacterium resistens]|uniref:GntR family transcriptional regulator n=1 Tax=Microbacterium resistens TaxID=156977 RepID=A0ABU1S7P4_9MICO|nr:GntR family transcriptional regulator [Microbacterium resistens]MDR6865640.1 GntR family transcriptional regulator [Microbacterium resistens]
MLIRIDPTAARPIYEQVAASVRADIAAGRLAPGDRLPPAREVAAAVEINVHTVLRAYQQLRDEDLIDLRRGRGAIVSTSAAPLAELAQDIRALVGHAAQLGLSPTALAALVKEATP